MSDAGDPIVMEQPLTRRELREQREQQERCERDRLASLTLAPAAPSSVPADIEPARIIEPSLTPAAELLVTAELGEPDLERAVVVESDRVIAAPPVGEVPASAFELLLSDGPTTMSIPIPTRAQLRAQEQAARSTWTRRPETAGRRLAAPAFRPSPAAPTAPPTARVRPAGARARLKATKGLSVVAMAFVALMAVSTSLPAEALLSSADVQAAAFNAQRSSTSEPAQSLALTGGTDTISVARDGYKAQSIAEYAAASGIRMEATFTNNPNGTIQWPFAVGVHIGSRFGFRDCAGCSRDHLGQDFNPGLGAPIQAIADGVVSQAVDGEGTLGVHMVIDHMIDGKLVSSVYAHMIHGSMQFKVGDVVKVADVIGKTGDTGMSTGPHLHFGIRLGGLTGTHVDPLEWLYANTN